MFAHQNAKALKAKKEEGNQAFKNNNYEAAYQLYTEALAIDPNNIKTNAKLYCNRATAGAKVKVCFIIPQFPLIVSYNLLNISNRSILGLLVLCILSAHCHYLFVNS